MGRNRLIYCLADAAVVVATSEGAGGTWAGATEALTARWVPVYVLAGDGVPPGNAALIARGAIALEGGPGGAGELSEPSARPESVDGGGAVQTTVAEQQTMFGGQAELSAPRSLKRSASRKRPDRPPTPRGD